MKTSPRQAATPQHRSQPRRNDWPHPKAPFSGQHPRRQFLHLAAGAAALPAVSRIATAQTYPSRPITMIVPLGAGGGPDVIGRILAERMRRPLGQPVVIENVLGADGSIGTGRASRARPDGYTIDLGTQSTHVLNSAFYPLRYDVLNDFTPISPLITAPIVFYARKTMPAKDLPELIAWLKANPNNASIGTYSAGGRLQTALFQRETGTQLIVVPYRGGLEIMQDLMAGRFDLFFSPPDNLPLVRDGSIKAYAVASDTRLARAPDIPTFAEMGLPGLFWSAWLGLFAPKGTSRDIVGKLNAATVEALADPAVRSQIADREMEIFPRERQTPEALAALQKADAEKWWPIIKELGIKAE